MTEPQQYPRFTSLHDAFVQSIQSTPTLPRDLALIALAGGLAERLDAVSDLIEEADEDSGRSMLSLEGVRDKLINRYLATLDRLGMAPGARTVQQGGDNSGPPDPSTVALSQLTTGAAPGSAAAGVDYAAAVDPSVKASLTGD